MTDSLRIALAQCNPTMGAIDDNVTLATAAWREAAEQGADLVVLPELFVSGYPPEDLVVKPAFVRAAMDGVAKLAAATADGPALVVGTPWREADDGPVYNAALLLEGGAVAAKRLKSNLPNYGVFDEKRVFAAAAPQGPVSFRGVRLGLCVCEDVWSPEVCETLEESGAEILLVINGSPYEHGKSDERLNIAVARVTETGLPMAYVNLVGGQDELVFDGGSFVLNADRGLALRAPAFVPAVVTTQWRRGDDDGWRCDAGQAADAADGLEAVYQAMVLGLRDYVEKNGFPGVVLGLSGGVDSALSAAVAVDALGPARVHCLMMPSPYTSQESLDDAAETAALLGTRLDSVAITEAMTAVDGMVDPLLGDAGGGVTKENVQSRLRGLLLMALSNASGAMLLTTGNKSEMSVGYATIYGDMCGGYSVLKDVYKTDVFALCRWRNQHADAVFKGPAGRVIPERVITKAPSAELRPDQKDEDSLPPYSELDDILQGLVERDLGVADLVAAGHDGATVQRIWRLLQGAEYKRRQAPPGVKISRRAFGRDRRYPITNRYHGSG